MEFVPVKHETYTNPDHFRIRLKQLINSDCRLTMAINAMMAGVMLESNTGNRPITVKRVEEMAKDMSEGKWVLTGEAIVFAKDGTLNNGQHRLIAGQQTDRPFVTDVRFGIEREAFLFTDVGKKRTQADALSIMGERRCNTLSAALAWVHRFNRGLPNASRDRCDIPTTLELLRQHPGMRDSVKTAMNATSAFPGFQAGPMSFAHYAMSRLAKHQADEFMFHLETGLGILSKTDPMYRLRQRIMTARATKAELRPVEQLALTFKAWNALRSKRYISQLSWRGEGPAAEPFPMPI